MMLLHPKVTVLLISGFALVILLMLATGKRALDALGELDRGTSGLLSEERATAKAVNHAQELELEFDEVYYSLPRTRRPLGEAALRERLAGLETEVRKAAASGREVSDESDESARWREFDAAALAFIATARSSVGSPADETSTAATTAAHARLARAVAQVVRDTDRRTERLATLDHAAFSRALEQHVTLLGAALLTALVVSGGTVFLVQRLFTRIEWQRQELARLSSDILDTQETTLRQVAHDLHDQFGQTLTAIEANLAALDAALPDRSLRGRVDDCVGLVQDLMSQARGMSQLLRPSILDDFGLSPSLEWLAERFMKRTGIDVTYTSTFAGRLGDETETHLFRIAQEAFTNVVRHAAATHVDLALRVDASVVELEVADNGRGLERPQPDGRQGLGLVGMRARAEQINGELRVGGRPGGGTQVIVRLPLPREAGA